MNTEDYKKYCKIDSSLRPYQLKAKLNIYNAWQTFDKVMFQMPTGTGKTRLFTSIINDINRVSIGKREPTKIIIIAHRKELIDQIDDSLSKYSIAHSLFVGDKKKRDSSLPVLVTMVQTMTHPKNADERKRLKDRVKYIIIDEAHHTPAQSYKKLWTCFPKAKILGVTATPYRLNHEGFTNLFGTLILSPSVKQFISDGWLAPYSYYSLRSDSFIQDTIDSIDEFNSFGDYSESALERIMDKDKIRAQLVDSYKRYAYGKKGIIYCINIEHCQHVCAKYESIGLRVASIDFKMDKTERKRIVDKFKRGDLDILVNVNIFSEGFDCPDIEFIQLARPTTSLSMYLQQVGRGLRITEGKTNCIILDNVGMYKKFGLPDAKRMWRKHFEGVEDPVDLSSRFGSGSGNGIRRKVDISEGSEQMILVQDINGLTQQSEDIVVSADDESYDAVKYLESHGISYEGTLVWDNDINDTFEVYLQTDNNYIISKFSLGEDGRMHRIRVANIPETSWAYERLACEHFDNMSIEHLGGTFTILKWELKDKYGNNNSRYYNYKGENIDPDEERKRYEARLREFEPKDFVDLQVNSARYDFRIDRGSYYLHKTTSTDSVCMRVPHHSVLELTLKHLLDYDVKSVSKERIVLKGQFEKDVTKIMRFDYNGDQLNVLSEPKQLTRCDVYKYLSSAEITRVTVLPPPVQKYTKVVTEHKDRINRALDKLKTESDFRNAISLNVREQTYDKVLSGQKKSISRAISDVKFANTVLENFDGRLHNMNNGVCPWKPKVTAYLKLINEKTRRLCMAQIIDISFRQSVDIKNQKVWVIVYSLGEINKK